MQYYFISPLVLCITDDKPQPHARWFYYSTIFLAKHVDVPPKKPTHITLICNYIGILTNSLTSCCIYEKMYIFYPFILNKKKHETIYPLMTNYIIIYEFVFVSNHNCCEGLIMYTWGYPPNKHLWDPPLSITKK